MRIAAVVILYHPPENVIDNIKSYYNYVERIYVFNNTETASYYNLSSLSKVHYFHDSQNCGIANRLNTACELSLKDGYEWILTMDQDTKFSEEAISNYFNCLQQYKEKNMVAAFGANFKKESTANPSNCQSEKVDRLITSGMLLNLSAYKKIGGFDESLFIDLVDDEYCIAATKAGYSIVQFPNIYTFHNLGKQVYRASIKSLYLIKKKKQIHSPLRCYYMYRNMLYIKEKYKDSNIKLVKEENKIVTSYIKVCILYGRKTWSVIKYLIAARRDFKNNKMGKIGKEL